MITLESLSADTIAELKMLYDYVIPVERIRSPNMANLYLMGRPDLSFAFTKIALWRQTQFRKIVYLDADVVALRALDELFDIDAPFAAVPDIGWPDAFNSGVMVIKPDMGEYWSLQTMAATGDSFDGADQGLLNQYFEHRPWQRLKFTYNCTPNAEYQWEPAYRYYKRDISAVHFIGKDKPWSNNRPAGHGVYGELLARWWAVHNRHLHDPKATQQSSQATSEAKGTENSVSQPQTVPDVTIDAPAPTAEPSMTDPSEAAEDLDQGLVKPTPTLQQRKFSAPEMEWDATKFEPPAQSKPEAANFPRETYTFNDSRQLFKAPPAYPEPPRDMWYKVPETKPKPYEAPKPIFPWEREATRPKATRVFAEDHPQEPTSAPASAVSEFEASPAEEFTTTYPESYHGAPRTKATRVWRDEPYMSTPKTVEESWQAFSQNSANAWDSVPGIDNYVRSIMDSQSRRGSVQVLKHATGTDELGSPTLSRKARRESLILTDFPSAVERPSLPVTPAPLRRPNFWGEERDETGELPAAEGVPEQNEWVCPQCGFSSSHASDFARRRGSFASVGKFVKPATVTVASAVDAPGLSLHVEEPLAQSKDDVTQENEQDIQEVDEEATKSPEKEAEASMISEPGTRSGLSPTGNPEAKLEQLRRSSLVEFEHLKKDEHPNPPLRALPEHSVLGDEQGEKLEVGGIVVAKSQRPASQFSSRQISTEKTASSQQTSQSSSKKQGSGNKVGFTMSDFGTSFGKRDKSSNLLDSGPTFSFEDTTPVDAFPEVGGFAERDFGGDSTNEQEIRNSSSSSSQHASSTTHHSMGPGHRITSDGRIKAGELTFNLPGFNSESASEAVSPIGEALSPTTTRDGKSGQGLF
ncbi:glycogenin glucosyltransferase [Neodidymelliopsis sp. IMI 364377]|nr:glycogenin glucosyltransferase [Neodidymelliopsis sp. IMI 364377]